MSTATEHMRGTPVRLLSLDGGGIRGLSELIILHEIMQRVKAHNGLTELPKPCDYFHLIGGTGTGGLIAILLGRLRMSTEEAIHQYIFLTSKVFDTATREQNGTFRATVLEDAMKHVIKASDKASSGEEYMIQGNMSADIGKRYGGITF